ncbi:MAG TPA: PIN domain-containing protein [Vicinamibacteria bacterium]|nr:PIN domain-containing protein [Vicinamibacteria bacterium]
MRAECFLDTNVLVYAAAGRGREEFRRERALALIEAGDVGVSAQVLQEFYVTVTRKIEIPMSSEQALEWVEQFEAFPCVSVDASLVKIAAEVSEQFRISYWDGAILSAAQLLGAETLYTEDLNDGQLYGAVRVVNPFGIDRR